MEKIPAKVSISIKEGIVEFSGSEKFVNEQLHAFKNVVERVLRNVDPKTDSKILDLKKISDTKTITSPTSDDLENIFDIRGQDVKIIAEIPGSKVPEKTVNAALLYLFGKSTVGIESVLLKEIRGVCKDHGFLGTGKNFATYMKKAQKDIIPEGAGKNMKARLTQPGLKKAKALAASLNEEESSS